ncbi:MAG: regulatory protein GemA [Burkholderiaceae bacterium]|nr:regulatory protein GemA [Burkholderiaceae bacterium]
MPATVSRRASDIKRIHVLRSRLAMDESAYRDLMASLFDGARSSTALDDAQRSRFVRHLQQLADGQPRTTLAQRKPLPPRQGKMFSLWQQLADAGLVRDRRMSALNAWIEGRTWLGQRVDSKEWLSSQREDQVIEALKRWLRRGKEEEKAADGQA